MAGTTTKSIPSFDTRQTAGIDISDLIREHNKLVDNVETLRASVQAGTGVTATAASALTAAKIGNRSGTAIT